MKSISILHNKNCDCLECIKESVYDRHISRAHSGWTDNLEGNPVDFIGGTLVALKPTPIYSSPGGDFIRNVSTGQTIGKIYSYVVRPEGVYWQVDTSDGGKGSVAFVFHAKGQFDEIVLKNSLVSNESKKQAEILAKSKERQNANENPLYNTGKFLEDLISFDSLKLVITGIIVLIIGTFLLRLFR